MPKNKVAGYEIGDVVIARGGSPSRFGVYQIVRFSPTTDWIYCVRLKGNYGPAKLYRNNWVITKEQIIAVCNSNNEYGVRKLTDYWEELSVAQERLDNDLKEIQDEYNRKRTSVKTLYQDLVDAIVKDHNVQTHSS